MTDHTICIAAEPRAADHFAAESAYKCALEVAAVVPFSQHVDAQSEQLRRCLVLRRAELHGSTEAQDR